VKAKKGVVIRTDQGDVAVDRTLIAAGGFSNALLGMALPLTIYARTVALIEIDASEAARLAGMPSMVLRLSCGRDPYLLPPIRYPDGKTYLKVGDPNRCLRHSVFTVRPPDYGAAVGQDRGRNCRMRSRSEMFRRTRAAGGQSGFGGALIKCPTG
jgi:glycine/D-amino acid oxidase-like deaminating enzyme